MVDDCAVAAPENGLLGLCVVALACCRLTCTLTKLPLSIEAHHCPMVNKDAE